MASLSTHDELAAAEEQAPMGWYPDPLNPDMVRYWDGSAWAEQTQPVPAPPPAPPVVPAVDAATAPLDSPSKASGTPTGEGAAGNGQRAVAAEETPPETSLATDRERTPAGWYPNPLDPDTVRYWDGSAWAEQTQPVPAPPPPPPPPLVPVVAREAIPANATTPVDAAAAPLDSTSKASGTPTGEGAAGKGERTFAEMSTEIGKAADLWVTETQVAMARAQAAGTAAAWGDAAQTAVVVAEMAETMRVAMHSRDVARQLADAAAEAERIAHIASKEADNARARAEQTAQAAEATAQAAQRAANEAADARYEAEQAVLAVPKAEQSAQVAAEVAVAAKEAADRLDEVVTQASQANTPEAWREARQIASAAWAAETGET